MQWLVQHNDLVQYYGKQPCEYLQPIQQFFFGGIYARHDQYNEGAAQFTPASTVDDTVDTGVTEAEVRKLLRELGTLWCSGLTRQIVIRRAQWIAVRTQQQATTNTSPQV